MSATTASWKLSAPDSRSQYSLVSGEEVTPEGLQVWVELPDEVKYDAALAPFLRLHEKHIENANRKGNRTLTVQSLALKRNQEHNEREDEHNVNMLDDETRHLNARERITATEDINMDSNLYENTKIGSGVKKKNSLRERGKHYCKISFLLACWAFFTSVLMLYSEKELVERHSALSVGEVKTYKISTIAESLRVWVNLEGPFWSEPLQKKYNHNITESDSFMDVWLERFPVSVGNETGMSAISVEKSEPWIVRLLEDSLIDLSEGEPRSSVLQITGKFSNHEAESTIYNYNIKMRHTGRQTVPFTITYSKNPLDPRTGIIYAAILLIGLYTIIIFDIINRTLAAILTSMTALAVLAMVGERPSMIDILSWMDSETLLLLFSMMVVVALMAETGVFDYLAVVAFEKTRGETWPLINLLYLLTIVVSLFLDNVTTVLLLTPAAIRLCEVTNLNPVPILMGMVIFCNVGGTATPVGDPPNIIIANNPLVLHSGIHFTNFTAHMTIGVFMVFVQTYLQFRFMFRDVASLRMRETAEVQKLRHQISAWNKTLMSLTKFNPEEKVVRRAAEKKLHILEQKLSEQIRKKTSDLPKESFEKTLKDLKKKYTIHDVKLLVQTLVAIGFIIIVFFLHSLPQLQSLSLGWSALLGAIMLLVLADKQDLQPVLSKLEWSTLLFFAALFIFMEAITKLGLIQWIGGLTEDLILQIEQKYQLPVAILLVLWISGLTSAFVDNIPLTSMMVRVVTSLGTNPNLSLPMAPLIWALSFGACLGGNGTLVGASANVIAAGIAEQYNYRFTFKEFFRIGAPLTLGHLATVTVYLLVSHCVFTWH